MTEESKPDVSSDRPDAPVETRDEPSKITDADRAANPFGTARREREQHRDEQGKFATKQEPEKPDGAQKPKPEAKPEAKPPEGGDKPNGEDQGGQQRQQPGTVPHQALEAERRKRQDLERQLAELQRRPPAPQPAPQAPPQPPAPPPSWFESPEKAFEHHVRGALDPIGQRQSQQTHYWSHRFAVQEHGQQMVDEADQAFGAAFQGADAATQARIVGQLGTSNDPTGDVVRWYKQQRAAQTYGADPEAYIKAEVERRMAEAQGGQQREQQPPAASRQPPPQQLPSSFAGQPGGGSRSNGYGGPKPLSEMLPRG